MIVIDIAVILNKKLIKKWFVIRKVSQVLEDKIEELVEEYGAMSYSRYDEFKFISFIRKNGIDAFFDKMKKDYSLEEVSLRDLVNNFTKNDLRNDYSIILDVDKTKENTKSKEVSQIYWGYDDGDFDLKDAVKEFNKVGIPMPLLSMDSLRFNPSGKKVYAIDCSLDMDEEYHSYFLLFETKEMALTFKKLFKNSTIAENISLYNHLDSFIVNTYGETTCAVYELPSYKDRIAFLVGATYFGEDEC